MGASGWMNVFTGQRLRAGELQLLRLQAKRLYEANTHIFEDEREALSALGAEPVLEYVRRTCPVAGWAPVSAA